jgi:fructose-1,6-bisphosphatase I
MSRAQTKVPVFDEVCDTTGVTLTRFMNEVAMLNPEIRELTTLFGAIDTACKAMSNLVKRSQLPSSQTLGYQGEVNIQGEDQKKLDVITNDLLKRALRFTGRLGVLASEEEDVPVSFFVPDGPFFANVFKGCKVCGSVSCSVGKSWIAYISS